MIFIFLCQFLVTAFPFLLSRNSCLHVRQTNKSYEWLFTTNQLKYGNTSFITVFNTFFGSTHGLGQSNKSSAIVLSVSKGTSLNWWTNSSNGVSIFSNKFPPFSYASTRLSNVCWTWASVYTSSCGSSKANLISVWVYWLGSISGLVVVTASTLDNTSSWL